MLLKRLADSVYYWTVKSPIWQWSMLYWDDFYRAHHRGNSSLLFALAVSFAFQMSVSRWVALYKSEAQRIALSLNESALSIYLLIARVIEIIVSPAIWNWRRLIIRGPPPDNKRRPVFVSKAICSRISQLEFKKNNLHVWRIW